MAEEKLEYLDAEKKELIESIGATPIEDFKPAIPDCKEEIHRSAQTAHALRELGTVGTKTAEPGLSDGRTWAS